MAVKNFLNKALKPDFKTEEEEYFFPDIEGQSITIKASSREEAEKKARKLIK